MKKKKFLKVRIKSKFIPPLKIHIYKVFFKKKKKNLIAKKK